MRSPAWSWLGDGCEISVMCLLDRFLSCLAVLGSLEDILETF